MENNPDTGAAMPKILQLTKKTHFEYAGAAGGFIDKWGFPFCRGRIFEELEEDKGQYNDNKEIFWATGACMFVRNNLYKKLGGLDEFFFAHMEEIDLCWRVKRAGYKIYAIGNSHVYHLGGGTLKKLNPKKTFLNFRNNLLMLVKNHPSEGFAIRIIQKLILDGIAGTKFLLEGKPNHTIAILKAHFSVYANFNKYLKIRKVLKEEFGDKSVSIIYPRLIIWDFFKKGKKKFSDLDID
jgi:GT2 family glycosyltransferase